MRPLNSCATCPACAVCEDDAFPIAASCEEMREIVSVVRRHFGEWISVEERLPEESGYTIVFCADGELRHVTFAKYQKTQKRWDLTGARSYWRVTHWMPLPEPPEGEST